MFIITGRIFTINEINPKSAQIVIKKQVRGKQTAIALDVFGFWKEKADALKLKKNDKIRGRAYLKSRLYNNKWYTDLYFREIQLVEEKQTAGGNELNFDDDIIGDVKHLYDKDGNIIF